MPEDATAADGEFVPPSIDETALLAGDTYSYYSPVPERLQAPSESAPADGSASETTPAAGVPCVLGVDEAGRGPVLGPMVYGVFYAPVAEADALLRGESGDDPSLRFDDSKVLSAATRAMLLANVCQSGSALHRTCGWAVALLSARDIGAGMFSPTGAGGNLNAQALDATVSLIRGVLARGVHVTDVFVDTVGPPATYQKKLERYFPGVRITVAKKADSLYPCVSAASVCAKVTRDVALEALYKPHGTAAAAATTSETETTTTTTTTTNTPTWGSGYPSDARCTTWLRQNMHPVFGWGPECRFSWGTAKDMLDVTGSGSGSTKKGGVQVEWPEPEAADGDQDDFAVTRMADFLAASPAAAKDEADRLGGWFGQPAGLEAF